MGVLSAGAMPTEAQLAKARPDVEELTATSTAAEIVELVGKAETEAVDAGPVLPSAPPPSGALYMVVDLSRGAKAKSYPVASRAGRAW